jgi:hypothetical protein
MSLAYVASGEVTSLKHEAWDDAVEATSLIAKALFPGAELSEVLSCLGHLLVVELECDSSRWACWRL